MADGLIHQGVLHVSGVAKMGLGDGRWEEGAGRKKERVRRVGGGEGGQDTRTFLEVSRALAGKE